MVEREDVPLPIGTKLLTRHLRWAGPTVLLIGILGYFLSSLSGVAMHVTCSANLRQIGLAINGYAEDYDGEFPPSLRELYPDYVNNPKLFSCVTKRCKYTGDFVSGKVSERSSSYVYLPGRFIALPGDFILAYDKPENHDGDGINAVFVDGHVAWRKMDTANARANFQKELAEQEAQLPELRQRWEKSGRPAVMPAATDEEPAFQAPAAPGGGKPPSSVE